MSTFCGQDNAAGSVLHCISAGQSVTCFGPCKLLWCCSACSVHMVVQKNAAHSCLKVAKPQEATMVDPASLKLDL